MPAAFRHNRYRFHFFSNEGDPHEPVHIHVTKDNIDAKFGLYPISVRATAVRFDEYNMWVDLEDGECWAYPWPGSPVSCMVQSNSAKL